jgi:hypothetical protein
VFGIELIPQTKCFNFPGAAEDEFDFENFKEFMKKEVKPKTQELKPA